MSVFDLLDREWAGLAADAAAARRLVDACELAGGARTLGEVERYVRAAAPPQADRVLVALAARSVEGDGLAARVLLQLLLPGTRRLARTWWALGDAEERAAAAVAAVYDRIRRYPLARRPRRIAANVLMDAGADLRRAARQARAAGQPGAPELAGAGGAEAAPPHAARLAGGAARAVRGDGADPTAGPAADPAPGTAWAAADPGPAPWLADADTLAPPAADPHPAVELAGVLADAVDEGIVTAEDAELIAASRIAGTPLAAIAARRGAKLRTLQWRRKRAEALLVGAAAGSASGTERVAAVAP